MSCPHYAAARKAIQQARLWLETAEMGPYDHEIVLNLFREALQARANARYLRDCRTLGIKNADRDASWSFWWRGAA